MNKRIKELINQSLPAMSGSHVQSHLEKFAELIVEECASICYKSNLEDSDAHAQNLLFEFNIDNCREDK